MSKRIEGPWSFVGNSWQFTTVYGPDGERICDLDLEDWGVTEDNQSDMETEQELIARLIAAAPEVCAALSSFPVRENEGDSDYLSRVTEWWLRRGSKALAKAGVA